jgi:hypothetical protein
MLMLMHASRAWPGASVFRNVLQWHGRLHVRVRVRRTCPGAVVCDYETLGTFRRAGYVWRFKGRHYMYVWRLIAWVKVLLWLRRLVDQSGLRS